MVFNATVAKPANGSQTLQHGKDPALKQQAFKPYLEGMRMRAIGPDSQLITKRYLAS